MERGDGRNRSEIPDLDLRIKRLGEDLRLLNIIWNRQSADPVNAESADFHFLRSTLFTAEAYAWALFLRLRAQLFESRLEMPRNDAEVFSILQKNDLLDLVEARTLRQFCELRFLSSRDLAKVDTAGVRELVSDIEWISPLLARFATAAVK